MKYILRNSVFYMLRLWFKVCFMLGRPSGSVFVIPDIPASNLGDQALLLGALEGFRKAGHERVTCVVAGERIPRGLLPLVESYGYNFVEGLQVLFVTDSAFVEKIKFYSLLAKHRQFFLVGADVLDGQYGDGEATLKLRMARDAQKIGLETRVFGFSVSADFSETVKQVFSSLPSSIEMFARDAISRDRVSAAHTCELRADCAFLMQPCDIEKTQNLSHFNQWCGRSAEPVLGVCVRKKDFTDPASRQLFLRVLKNVSQKLVWRIAFLPHHPDDLIIQKALLSQMSSIDEDLAASVFVFDTLIYANEVKAAVSKCCHVLTSRMHVGIASLGMQTPITCIPYGGKFEGLLLHFGLEGGIVDPALWQSEEAFSNYLIERCLQSSEIKNKVAAGLSTVQDLSLANFVPRVE